MKVIATQKGFHDHRLRERGDEFEIPDKPTRKLVDSDDDATRAAATKGQIPAAFSSHWMKLRLESEEAPAKASKDAGGNKTDLNAPVI